MESRFGTLSSAVINDSVSVTIEDKPCVTTLRGTVVDQAALMGVLNLAYDLGMVLLRVERENILPTATA